MAWGRKKKDEDPPQPAAVVSAPKRAPAPSPAAKAAPPPTCLSDTTSLVGDLKSRDAMLISGKVEGSIECDRQVTIHIKGQVTGKINCGSIVIHGEVQGDIHAREEVVIESTGRLTGDIYTKVFTHHPGGFFEGYSHMLANHKKTGGAAAATQARAKKANPEKQD